MLLLLGNLWPLCVMNKTSYVPAVTLQLLRKFFTILMNKTAVCLKDTFDYVLLKFHSLWIFFNVEVFVF
jgi:hypothetical protein